MAEIKETPYDKGKDLFDISINTGKICIRVLKQITWKRYKNLLIRVFPDAQNLSFWSIFNQNHFFINDVLMCIDSNSPKRVSPQISFREERLLTQLFGS